MHRRGVHHGFVEIFLSHRNETKNFESEPFCISEFFCYGKKLWKSEGARKTGITTFNCNCFCPTVPKNFVWNTSVFQKSLGIEKFLIKKRVSLFSVELFCLSVPIEFLGAAFSFSEKFCHRRTSCIVEWGPSRFCQMFFVPQCQKTSLGNPPVLQKLFWIEKLWYQDFSSKISCPIASKKS